MKYPWIRHFFSKSDRENEKTDEKNQSLPFFKKGTISLSR